MEAAVPQHIAVIMDGNGRWARQRGKPRTAGHQAGVGATRDLVESCLKRGIPYLTIFAFSSENWRRPKTEVRLLMDLFLRSLHKEVPKLDKNKVRMRFIGDCSGFSETLQKEIRHAEEVTQKNQALNLQIAVNYGGRWDISQAAKKIAHAVKSGELDPDSIDEHTVTGFMSTGDTPDPDLFIRTGGEYRVSNYLLWQLAYTELFFSEYLWPDFDDAALAQALDSYASRQRRFGKTGEQLGTQ